MKTIKQIADHLGISKDKVKYQVRKLPGNYLVKMGNITHITDEGMAILKDSLMGKVGNGEVGNSPGKVGKTYPEDVEVNKAIIDMLKAELDIKNEQIKDLNNRLAETTQALLVAQQTTHQEQLLHGHTKLIGGEEATTKDDKPPKVGFWERIFGRKKG